MWLTAIDNCTIMGFFIFLFFFAFKLIAYVAFAGFRDGISKAEPKKNCLRIQNKPQISVDGMLEFSSIKIPALW